MENVHFQVVTWNSLWTWKLNQPNVTVKYEAHWQLFIFIFITAQLIHWSHIQKSAVQIIHNVGFIQHTQNPFIQPKLFKIHELVEYTWMYSKDLTNYWAVTYKNYSQYRWQLINWEDAGISPKFRSTCKTLCVCVCTWSKTLEQPGYHTQSMSKYPPT